MIHREQKTSTELWAWLLFHGQPTEKNKKKQKKNTLKRNAHEPNIVQAIDLEFIANICLKIFAYL